MKLTATAAQVDKLISKHVFDKDRQYDPPYSTDWGFAGMVLDKLKHNRPELTWVAEEEVWLCHFEPYQIWPSDACGPMAICLSALALKGIDVTVVDPPERQAS